MNPTLRQPVVAGRLYEAEASPLVEHARQLCRLPDVLPPLPERLVGGIAPHAGWMCSGRLAGLTLAALAARSRPVTVVLTGSVHTLDLRHPATDTWDGWRTPLGIVSVDDTLRQAMAGLEDFATLDAAHVREHSLEAELPLVQTALGEAVKIVPVMIPPVMRAVRWGEAMGELLAGWPQEVVVLCSTDLTHYGPGYGFEPAGRGEAGRRWAHEVNDARLLELIARMDAEAIVEHTQEHHSACGGGAIAATLACCREMGAGRAVVLDHSDSVRELERIGMRDRDNSVGYASVVIG